MRKYILNKKEELFVVYLLAGFLLSSSIPSLIGMKEVSFNIIYRGSVLLLSLLFIFLSLNKRISFKGFGLLMCFFGLYFFRLFHDLLLSKTKLYEGETVSEYLQLALGVVVIPTVAILFLDFKKFNFSFAFRALYNILLGVLILTLILRLGTDISGRSRGDLEIGILLYGQYGTTLSILSFYMLVVKKINLRWFIYLVGFIVGFITIYISASRSPFLALLLCMMLFMIVRYGGLKSILIITSCGLVLYLSFFQIMSLIGEYFQSSFLIRLELALEEGNSGREDFLYQGFDEFINSPFFGNAFLIQNGVHAGSYPHNLILEAFMATGFFGGIIFFIWVIKNIVVSRLVIMKRLEFDWIALIFYQFLIFAMFSGSLYKSNLFWYYTAILVASYQGNLNNKNA